MANDEHEVGDEQATPVTPEGGDQATGPPDPDSTIRLDKTAGAPSSAGLALAAGAVVANRYRIIGELGAGGMGIVYRAHDRSLDIEVALKILRPEVAGESDFLERFRNELLMARTVTHRNVVRIHDIGEDGELTYMSMDYIRGRSLQELLRQDGPMELEPAMEIMRQMADALAEAHHQGVIHRDLKPANILLDLDGRAYISDFGIARSLAAPGLTRSGVVMGTPHYLSPEQARGKKVDGRSDLYTLGLIFVEILSGKLPFPGGTLMEIISQRMQGETHSLEELGIMVPPAVASIIDRCLKADPDQRYQTAEELLSDLADPARPLQRQRSQRLTRGLVITAWVVAAAITIGGIGLLMKSSGIFEASNEAAKVAKPEAGLRVAVLPFWVQGGNQDLAWAGNGVQEMVTRRLTENRELRVVDSVRVIQRLSDLGFTSTRLPDHDLVQVGEVFEVDRLVVGTVTVVGDQVRIEARVIELDRPGSPVTLLQTISGGAAELLELVDQAGSEIQRALDVKRTPGFTSDSGATSSPEAMQAYSDGLARFSEGNYSAAVEALEESVTLDPNSTSAWTRLARAQFELGHDSDALASASEAVRLCGDDRDRLSFEAHAQEALFRGDPEAAQGFLEELVNLYPNDLEAHMTLAESMARQGDLGAAVERMEQAAKIDPSEPRVWFLLGKYTIQSGDPGRAVDDLLTRALVLQNRLNNRAGQAEVHNAMGIAYRHLSQLELAEESFNRAAEISLDIGDRAALAKSLNNLVPVHLDRGNLNEAEKVIGQAMEIQTELGNRLGMADLATTLGSLEELRGRYSESLEHFKRALQLRNDVGIQAGLAAGHTDIGYIYFLLGDYDNALLYHQKSLDLALKAGDSTHLVHAQQSIGFCQQASGRWSEATSSYLESLELARKLDQPLTEAVSVGNLGVVAGLQGRTKAALASFTEAIGLFEPIQATNGLIEFTLHRGHALLEIGDLHGVDTALASIEQWLGDDSNAEQTAAFLELSGRTDLRRGDLVAARAKLETAVATAQESQAAAVLVSTRLALAEVMTAATGHGQPPEILARASAAAEHLGQAALMLRAGELQAAAELDGGSLERAQQALNRTTRVQDRVGSYRRAWRLHQLRAQLLERQGDSEGAARELRRAAAEVMRLQENLTAEQGQFFISQPHVAAVLTQIN